MADRDIEREIVIDAPREVVWRTITDPALMVQWFGDRIDLSVEPGARGTIGFAEQGGPILVETVEPPAHFSFRWNAPDGEEPVPGNSILVSFRLTTEGDGRTRLRVSESGHERRDWAGPEKERYAAEHQEGWGDFLDRLIAVVAQQPR